MSKRLAHELGTSQRALCNVLAGRTPPGPKIAKALGLLEEKLPPPPIEELEPWRKDQLALPIGGE